MLKSPQLVRFRTRYDRYREHFRRLGVSRPRLFVFVVTYGRTGSKLLQKLLNSADGVYVSGENHDVLRGLFEACRNARIALGGFGQHCKSIDDPWHGAFMVDPDTLERRLADAFVAAVLRPPRGHDVVGFKEIRYLVPDLAEQLDFMARVFVPAVFVFNRRDVGAVSCSAWWRNEDTEVLARKIEAFDAATDAFARAHPNSCVKLDYDEWTRDPSRLRPMFDLIDPLRYRSASMCKRSRTFSVSVSIICKMSRHRRTCLSHPRRRGFHRRNHVRHALRMLRIERARQLERGPRVLHVEHRGAHHLP